MSNDREPLTSDEQVFNVVNPASGESIAEYRSASSSEVDAAVQKANEATAAWRYDAENRRAALRQCAKSISNRRNSTELARLLTQEQGKPFREAMTEVYGAAHWFATTAEIEFDAPTFGDEQPNIRARYEPLGVVAAITPWNYPLLLATSKIAPALLAGNTVVLKPSPFTPLATRRMCEILTSLPISKDRSESPLPPNVLQVVVGGGQVGRQLIQHGSVHKVTFTGSTHTGQAIARTVAGDLKRITLELGGNDAAIVLADADVDAITERLFWGAFTNAGQFCVGIKRLYVHQSLFEPVVTRLVGIAEGIKQGDGAEGGMQMGPVSNSQQFAKVKELVDTARQNGACVRTGGQPIDRPGFFYLPTIVTDVADTERLVQEEQFGPALPIMSFADEQEAVNRANATTFGLGGSVWTSDLERGMALAASLECGTSWVNQHGVLDPLVPFGGCKLSGVGYENGIAGLREFLRLHVVNGVAMLSGES